MSSCAFMRLRGAFAGPEAFVPLGDDGVALTAEDRGLVDAGAAYDLLQGPSQDLATPVRLGKGEVWGSLWLWVALRDAAFCTLNAEARTAGAALVPALIEGLSFRFTLGLLDGGSMALLTPAEDEASGSDDESPGSSFPVAVRAYGTDGERLGRRLGRLLAAWDAAGRPGNERLRVRACPLPNRYEPLGGEVVVDKRWTRFVVAWGSESTRGRHRGDESPR